MSFVLSTHNRRAVLLNMLEQVQRCGLSREQFETFVVDNASSDGSADAVARDFPGVRLIRQSVNRGSCAKNLALPRTRGQYIVFLDDDSYPRQGSIARMCRHFQGDPTLGAAVFTVHLPDGSRECSAYPDVFIGCGTGFRRDALLEAGGLPSDYFQQAEEYDLSLRLLDRGWQVRSFDDLHVEHLKSPQARRSNRVMRLDVRNNLVLIRRYFPDRWAKSFALDWLARYYRLAAAKNQRVAFALGALQGLVRSFLPGNRRPITDQAFESFTKMREIEARLRFAQQTLKLRSILLIDLGKNILPFWLAAHTLGIEVVAIADQRLGSRDKVRFNRYRGVPIVTDDQAQGFAFDAAVISNISPVHAAQRRNAWRRRDARPIIDLFEPSAASYVIDSISAAVPAASGSRRIAARNASQAA